MGLGPATGLPDADGLIEQPLFPEAPPASAEPVITLLHGDVIEALETLPEASVQTCITSPPYYGLRSYNIPPRVWGDGQECVLGEEALLRDYLLHLCEVFRHVRRVLRPDGTLWLNLGDCYAGGGKHPEPSRYAAAEGSKTDRARQPRLRGKDLLMVPARAALALQADGWVLRSDIIWAKGLSFCEGFSGAVMPESTRDRPTWSHEHVFLFSREESYYYDIDGCREPYAESSLKESRVPYRGRGRKGYATAGVQNPSDTKRRVAARIAADRGRPGAGRNLRNVWVIGKQNFPGAHFATFPERLVEPMVRLGSSERGGCGVCGTPFVRVVQRSAIPAEVQEEFEASREATAIDTRTDGHTLRRPNHIREVLGEEWVPGCDCRYAEFNPVGNIPQVVLDPFCGSGRTGIVAARLGRSFVGIDINRDYIDMAAGAISAVLSPQEGASDGHESAGGRRGGRKGRAGRADRNGDHPAERTVDPGVHPDEDDAEGDGDRDASGPAGEGSSQGPAAEE